MSFSIYLLMRCLPLVALWIFCGGIEMKNLSFTDRFKKWLAMLGIDIIRFLFFGVSILTISPLPYVMFCQAREQYRNQLIDMFAVTVKPWLLALLLSVVLSFYFLYWVHAILCVTAYVTLQIALMIIAYIVGYKFDNTAGESLLLETEGNL